MQTRCCSLHSCLVMHAAAPLVTLLGCLLWSASALRFCEKSGYCSVGTSKAVYTDISKPGQLNYLLESVAYKKEVIITVFTQGDLGFLDLVLQLQDDLRSQGYGHVVTLTFREQDCLKIQQFIPEHACVWDTSPISYGLQGGAEHLWHLRWRFTARASRMGYNVMSLDNDVAIFDDPYRHLKAPPMDKVNIFCAAESEYGCNGGFMYVQNARPDGPASWVFKQTTDVPLRWMDDHLHYISSLGRQHQSICNKFDQALIDDAIRSTLMGQIIHPSAIVGCWGDDYKPTGLTKWDMFKKLVGMLKFEQHVKFVKVHTPADWGPAIAPNEEPGLAVANITQPHAKGYPAELGGRLYPEQRGNFSGTFIAQLKDDCPGCPWWPDEAPGDEAKAAAIKEVWGIPQRWFAASMIHRQRAGHWFPSGGYPAQQVIGHAHYVGSCLGSSCKWPCVSWPTGTTGHWHASTTPNIPCTQWARMPQGC